MARSRKRRTLPPIVLLLAIGIIMVLQVTYTLAIQLYTGNVGVVGGTGMVDVGHGYVIYEQFSVFDNASGGYNSYYFDTIVNIYRLAYSIDNGTYRFYLVFVNSTNTYYGSTSLYMADNATSYYVIGSLGYRSVQGGRIIGAAQVEKSG